ncbi:dicarboxylate/amino acid:cation symporter [Lachnospiraceae bacterium C1.1]|nr:dicarboxylate/amino acid:cation symporter [Lachnospiraceae bacterium C1.1]
MRGKIFKADRNEIPAALEFIQESLNSKKTSRKIIVKSLLAAEEILGKICENAYEGSKIEIAVASSIEGTSIVYNSRGDEFTLADIENRLLFDNDGHSIADMDEQSNEVMQGLISKLFEKNLSISCTKGKVHVRQKVDKSPYLSLLLTFSGLILGILTGLLLQYCVPADISSAITKNILLPIYTILMNCLKMIVAPLVFFAIAGSIAGFTDLRVLGRIAGKIMIMYIVTSILAISVGFLTYMIFPIGNPTLAQAVDAEAATETIQKGAAVEISIVQTIIDIFPTDIISPFQKSNMLQIIFMAVCLGLSAASLTKTAPVVREFIMAMDKVFSHITGIIVSLMPLMVFCSMAKMMSTMKLASFMDVITWIPVIYAGDLIMLLVYIILLLIFTGLNPFKFISKYYPAMISAFTTASSNAALPSSIRQCRKIGIDEKVYSFSLPLGATINMDGSCITLIISALFFARIYQLPMTHAMLLQLFITIIVLSVGSPGVPGGNLVCLTLLVPQIGVPAEAISLVIGLYPIVSMMQTLANVTGDAVVTSIAAKSEGMLDIKTYNG